MFKNGITDVFFDLDHTLWDFEKNSALTFERIFQQLGLAIDLEVFLRHYRPINQQYWKLYRENGIDQKSLRFERLDVTFKKIGQWVDAVTIDRISNAYIENLSQFGHLIPGAIDILDYLKPNYRLHIITNGFDQVQTRKMRNSNIDRYFEIVVNSEMAGVKKPNPRIFELALELAHTKVEESVMIGDNLEADILGAKELGFKTIHLLPVDEEIHGHGEIVYGLGEIKNLL